MNSCIFHQDISVKEHRVRFFLDELSCAILIKENSRKIQYFEEKKHRAKDTTPDYFPLDEIL